MIEVMASIGLVILAVVILAIVTIWVGEKL